MPKLPGRTVTAAREARLNAYAAARDDGMDRYQAAELVGISRDSSTRYERWYRDLRGMPARPRRFIR